MTALSDIPLKTLDGAPMSLGDHKGEVLLLVNVASKCGFTPQYTGLEALYERLKPQGFSIIGFPANDFGAQEPGTEDEIATFCSTTYEVTFPISSKITVVGPDKHPLYDALIHAQPKAMGDTEGFRAKLRSYGMEPNPEPEVLWNFEKFVVARDGSVVARFPSSTTPDDAALVGIIEAELAK
jgi:glutathione peroxidase